MEMVGGIGRRLDKCRKRLTEARTAWRRDRLENDRILEWKPYLVGFRVKFGDACRRVGVIEKIE